MNIAWALVVVSVLGGGKAPETQVVLQGVMEQDACEKSAKDLNSAAPVATDDVTGRSLLSRVYTCTPINPKRLQADLDKLPK